MLIASAILIAGIMIAGCTSTHKYFTTVHRQRGFIIHPVIDGHTADRWKQCVTFRYTRCTDKQHRTFRYTPGLE